MRTYPERAFSPSSLSAFAKSPAHYVHYCTASFEQSLPMLEGNIFEAYLTQADTSKYMPLILPEPEKGMVSKANKAAFGDALECLDSPVKIDARAYLSGDVYIVESSILERLEKAANAVKCRLPQNMLEALVNGEKQKQATKEGLTGVADIIRGTVGVDIKRYADASTKKFERAFFADTLSREALQVGAYSMLFDLSEFYFLICEPSEPFAFNIIKIEPDAMKWAERQTLMLLKSAKAWAAVGMPSISYFDPFMGYNSLKLPLWKR